MKHEYGVLRRTAEVIGDIPVTAPLFLPQIEHRLAWFQTGVSAVSGECFYHWETYLITIRIRSRSCFMCDCVNYVTGILFALFTA
jgi:hypothetical protein